MDVKLSEMMNQNNRLEKVWRQLYQSDFSQNKLIGEIDYQRPLQLFDPTKLLTLYVLCNSSLIYEDQNIFGKFRT